jgi:hypothetical protein
MERLKTIQKFCHNINKVSSDGTGVKYLIQHDIWPVGKALETKDLLEIDFEKGIQDVDLLEIVRNRLQLSERSRIKSLAITKIEEALLWLNFEDKKEGILE